MTAAKRRFYVASPPEPVSSPGPDISQQDVFDRIAPGWYSFRHRSIFTKELNALAEQWQSGKFLNLGCGHGPDFLPFAGRFELYGVDFSAGMLEMAPQYAAKHGFDAFLARADIRQLPYPDGFFDFSVAVAVIHHIDSAGERLKALAELKRVLRPGGEAFITAWNYTQPRFWFGRQDVLVPWRQGNEVLQRYYHLFSYNELIRLARKAGFEVIRAFPESSHRLPCRFFSRNICLLVKNPG
jgi:tRNA (uracil-5-)-methyltransferase TRM9